MKEQISKEAIDAYDQHLKWFRERYKTWEYGYRLVCNHRPHDYTYLDHGNLKKPIKYGISHDALRKLDNQIKAMIAQQFTK